MADLLRGADISRDELDEIIKSNNKKRYELSEDGLSIRACQGHTVDVELGYKSSAPPEFLFHGTGLAEWELIQNLGIKKMQRHHVHLSVDPETAVNVAKRRRQPLLLIVDSKQMLADGYDFYLATNGVWLVDEVPPKYIRKYGDTDITKISFDGQLRP